MRRHPFKPGLIPRLLLCCLTLLGSACAAHQDEHEHGKPEVNRAAKYIILFIGDGMHLENEIAASRYLYGQDEQLSFHRFPYQNNVTTWDVTTYNDYASRAGRPPYNPSAIEAYLGYDPALGGIQPRILQYTEITRNYFLNPRSATDSASAATAISTGHKTEKGRIAWGLRETPDGRLTTIAEILRDQKGAAVGLVTTVPFNHATPAAFVSHSTSRKDFDSISRDMLLQSRPEVVIGGGHPQWSTKTMSRELYSSFAAGGLPEYVVVERVAGEDGSARLEEGARRAAGQGKKLFGLFGGAEGNFASPLPVDRPESPSVGRSSREDPLLQEATLAALKVLSRDPDGFFLMVEQGDIDWANHNNDFKSMIGCVWDLHTAVETVEDYIDEPGDDITWENTLVIVTADHATGHLRLNDRKRLAPGNLPTQVGKSYPDGEVSYGSTSHTNELVRVYARGAGTGAFNPYEGSWYPKTRIIDNTHLFHVMTDAAGLPQPSSLKLK
ncbi:MAG: alkaline phosphatase [Syntrophobacteraceae bacterium]